jgi:hypothetical protein
MLKLRRLAQKIGQLLAVSHHDGRLCPHRRNVSPAVATLNGHNIAQVLPVAEAKSPVTSADV